jgi:carboxypeptidase D
MRLFHSPPVRRRGWAGSATWLVWIAANLWLGTKIVGADKTAADYFVHSLPGQPDGPLLKMHAG